MSSPFRVPHRIALALTGAALRLWEWAAAHVRWLRAELVWHAWGRWTEYCAHCDRCYRLPWRHRRCCLTNRLAAYRAVRRAGLTGDSGRNGQ